MTLPLSTEEVVETRLMFMDRRALMPNDPVVIRDHGVVALQKRACEIYGVTLGELCGPLRCRRYAHARQWVFYHAVMSGRFSTPDIGRRTGGRDHSTVIHGSIAHAMRHGLPLPGHRDPADVYPTPYEGPEPTLESRYRPGATSDGRKALGGAT